MREKIRQGDDKLEPAAAPVTDCGSAPSDSVDAFARLLSQNQRQIFLYVMSLVPDWNDAEEIVQETNLVLWRASDRFEPGTNFGAWACKVAFHQVLAWRKRVKRNRLEFSQEFLEAVAEEAGAASDVLEERWQRLARCIERLPAERRLILRLRYSDELSVAAIARQLGRNENAVYHTLGRTRRALHECATPSRLKEG